MSDWYVLDRDSDPAPGDPDQVHALANRLSHNADLAASNTSRLRTIAAADSELQMEGDYAPTFRQALGELPDELSKMEHAYRLCGNALAGFAASLDEAKTKASVALRDGRDAYHAFHGALHQARSLLPPDRQAMFSSGLSLNEWTVQAATADLDENIKIQVRAAIARARTAEADRERAKRLAQEAAELRGDAETRCVNEIHNALNHSGIRNREWYEKAWDFVSAPFRSWDAFVDLCNKIAIVAGVVALFISGPIGWALVAASLIAGAVVFADAVNKYAHGQGSLWDVGFASLGLIPGTAGVFKLSGLLKGVSGALRGGLRSGFGSLMRNGRKFIERLTHRDPIDVASGEMVIQQTDLSLPGVLPLLLTRSHVSSYRVGRWFGISWASTVDQRIEVDGAGICYAADDGSLLAYPTPAGADPVLPEEGPRLPLTRVHDTHYTVTDLQAGHTLHFMPAGAPTTGVMPLAMVTDRNGNRMELIYDVDGILREIRHTGGYRITVHTESGRITRLSLGDQTLIEYRYDHAGHLTGIVNSSGLPLTYQYDPAGHITGWEDRNGTWYRYTYDADGYCVATSGSDGCLDGTLTYDLNNRITAVTDSLGHTTTYHLDDRLNVTRETNPLGHTTLSEWDHQHRLLRRTDPLGRTTSNTYDNDGNLTTITRPDGSTATTEYNTMCRPVAMTAPDGMTWLFAYDEGGNLTSATDPIGATTRYTYRDHGGLASTTDALGHTRHMETNAAGIPTAITTATGATTRYDRDALGHVVVITDPLGAITRQDWTIEGKIAQRVLPDGATEHWRYDPEGNLIEHTDPIGGITHFAITHFDLPAARITPVGAQLTFAYDTELRLVTVTNPQGLVWRYEYDPTGQLMRETDFNGRTVSYGYDVAGQLTSRTNGIGQVITYGYDLLGNMTEQHAPDGLTTYNFDPVGRLIRAINSVAELTITRDALGRILAEICNGRTVHSTYDVLGNRVSRSTPSGAESRWEYGPDGQPTTLLTAGKAISFGYDALGRETARQLPGGMELRQAWNANSRLTSQTLAARTEPMIRRNFSYRADGYLIGIDNLHGGQSRFDVDPVGRIITAKVAGWTERYEYDAAGSTVNAAWQGAPTPDAEIHGLREYTGTLIKTAGKIRYEHDVQGRVILRQRKETATKPSTWRYTWDVHDRLTTITTPDGHTWRYSYDPLGRRISKERLDGDGAAAERVDFTWDGVFLTEQAEQTGLTTWEWRPDDFRALTQFSRSSPHETPQEWIDEQFYAIVTDLAGAPSELVTPDGEVAWQARTTIWGFSAATSTSVCPLRFPGQYHDAETGLHYNYHRYYDPGTTRYLSSDPRGLAASPDPHAYVINPTQIADPLALAPGDYGRPKLDADGWPIPTMDNCLACAKEIQEQIGGVIHHIKDAYGAPGLGPSTHDPFGRWTEHYAVIKNDMIYDAFTKRVGMPFDAYRAQWVSGDYLRFWPVG